MCTSESVIIKINQEIALRAVWMPNFNYHIFYSVCDRNLCGRFFTFALRFMSLLLLYATTPAPSPPISFGLRII